jgi:serine/threonine protein kinase
MIGRPLKKGQVSVIYKGFDQSRSGKVVAIKEYFPISFAERGDGGHISPRLGYEQEFYEGSTSFQQEAEILGSLTHRHIVACHGLAKAYGTVYIVTDFCGEESLEDICARSILEEKSAIDVILPILDALEFAHSKGVIHCDVNPSNIHLKSSGDPILLDFGSARFLDTDRNFHRPLTWNPGYSAPEQHSQKLSDYRPWTDVYACAATLYQLTTGKRLLAADRRSREPILSSSLTSRFSESLNYALSLDPYDRPSSMAEFRSDLKGPSISSGATVYSGPHTTQGKIVQQFVLKHIPSFLIMVAFLLAAAFIHSARDRGPFPTQTETTLLVRPSDFYILRDASVSIDNRYYNLVEDILKDSIRTTEESNDRGADYTSYAHFAQWSTNGTYPLQPAGRGDIIAETKRKFEQARFPRDFLLRTDFDALFKQTLSAIRASRAGAKDRKRAAVVSIITDGVHDPLNTRGPCPDVTQDQFELFDVPTKESFRALAREANVRTFIFLLGAPPGCPSGGIEAKWDELAAKFSSSGQVEIVSLEGYAQNRDPQDGTLREKLGEVINSSLSNINRAPFVAIRPAINILSDEQRESFDGNGEFYLDYVFQPHLCGGLVSVEVLQASLLGEEGAIVAPLSLRKSGFRVFSDGSSLRNGEETRETLAFKIGSKFEPHPDQAYQVHLTAKAKASDSVIAQVEGDIKIERNLKSRLSREKARRLLWVSVIAGAIAILFSAALVTYWRQVFWPRHSHGRRILRSIFIKPLRYWIGGFCMLGLLMLCSLVLMISSADVLVFPWVLVLGILILIGLFLWSQELIKKEAVAQLSGIHVLLSCVESILGPIISVIVSISQLK